MSSVVDLVLPDFGRTDVHAQWRGGSTSRHWTDLRSYIVFPEIGRAKVDVQWDGYSTFTDCLSKRFVNIVLHYEKSRIHFISVFRKSKQSYRRHNCVYVTTFAIPFRLGER